MFDTGKDRTAAHSVAGFTLVELVVVLVVLAIVSAVALPRFFNLSDYRTRAAYDEIAGAVRYAQKLAVASGCDVQVAITANSYALQQHATSCTSGAFTTISDHPVTAATLSGVTVAPTTSFIFDAMGRCSSCSGNVTFTVDGKAFTLYAETGYVDAQ